MVKYCWVSCERRMPSMICCTVVLLPCFSSTERYEPSMRFAAGLLQKLHRLLPFVLFVLLTHLEGGSLLLVFYVLVVGTVNAEYTVLRLVSYPVDLGVLQQELHDLGVASPGRKVQRRAQLAVQQVGITVPLLQEQLGGLRFAVPGRDHTHS
ncbi:hypothetical protein EYF80_042417 [Liparis tanakae]|uniref:Uncharacterized protein n=1 Tax=Liparis tanakae TaxID=230148 RepID=A0A4Z2G3N2_9TELE|nr:hypothetical protein EYF80_042417 [Liparis tanakae]